MKALARRLAPLPRDKADTLLLLGSSVLVLAPHAAHLPLWVSLLCAATLGWRALITLRGKRMPPSLVLLPVAVAAMAGVQFTYNTLLGRDAGVAMLVLLVAFKMLEMHARRDLYVVIFLCFFLVLTNFFYSQGIGTALLMLASVVALLTAQLSFHFTASAPPLRARVLMGARILALAAPLALLMFVIFPRIQGPLWGMGGDAAGRSGLSDRMSPGRISQLAQSEEVAFRVRFEGAAPPRAQLYWRGPVLGAYDGATWTRVSQQGRHPGYGSLALSVRGPALRYEVTLEPSNARWLFALEMAERLPEVSGHIGYLSPEFEMTTAYPVQARVRYSAASYLDFNLQPERLPAGALPWLQLPEGTNPRALAAGRALQALPDAGARVMAGLQRFTHENFIYTLEPPLLGADAVDQFLYRTRAGFCEHYAGAFVFLMRAAGVPARVVTGYQGGEINPVDGYLTVRQSDAHAWAEVWLAGRGWVRVDPTAAVAPERVQRGLAHAVEPRAPFGIEAFRGLVQLDADGNSWMARARYALAAINNGWNQWVLNYTPERQRGLLDALRAALSGWPALLGLALGMLVLLLGRTLLRRRENDPIDALYSVLCQRLGQLGLARAVDEGPSAYAARVASCATLTPGTRAAATEFLRRYSAWRYAPRKADHGLAATLKSLLLQVR